MKKNRLINIRISAFTGSCSGCLIRYLFLLAGLLILSSCSTLRDDLIEKTSCFIPSSKKTLAEDEVRNLVSALQTRNNLLKTYKGIGKLKIIEHGKLSLNERLAWIGTDKDRIRIAVLVTGRPAVNIASDGRWFYYQDAGSAKGTVKRKRYSKNASLERLIKIPVSLSHVICLLTGRVPVRKYNTVECESYEKNSRVILVLKKWRRIVEKIYLSENPNWVDAVEMYDSAGSLVYRASFEKMLRVKGYWVPSRIVITNDKPISLHIDIDRYIVDIPVTDEMFVLEPEKSENQ